MRVKSAKPDSVRNLRMVKCVVPYCGDYLIEAEVKRGKEWGEEEIEINRDEYLQLKACDKTVLSKFLTSVMIRGEA